MNVCDTPSLRPAIRDGATRIDHVANTVTDLPSTVDRLVGKTAVTS